MKFCAFYWRKEHLKKCSRLTRWAMVSSLSRPWNENKKGRMPFWPSGRRRRRNSWADASSSLLVFCFFFYFYFLFRAPLAPSYGANDFRPVLSASGPQTPATVIAGRWRQGYLGSSYSFGRHFQLFFFFFMSTCVAAIGDLQPSNISHIHHFKILLRVPVSFFTSRVGEKKINKMWHPRFPAGLVWFNPGRPFPSSFNAGRARNFNLIRLCGPQSRAVCNMHNVSVIRKETSQ